MQQTWSVLVTLGKNHNNDIFNTLVNGQLKFIQKEQNNILKYRIIKYHLSFRYINKEIPWTLYLEHYERDFLFMNTSHFGFEALYCLKISGGQTFSASPSLIQIICDVSSVKDISESLWILCTYKRENYL
jgi:hypothetical protein